MSFASFGQSLYGRLQIHYNITDKSSSEKVLLKIKDVCSVYSRLNQMAVL